MAVKEKIEVKDEGAEVLETLAPAEVYYTIGEGEDELTLVQKPLTFFGKIEFFSVVGKAVQKILVDGGSLSELLDTPDFDPTVPLSSNVTDADIFVKAISRIIESAPDLLKDLYLVAFNIPKGQRDYYALRLEELTDEQGMQVLDVFVDQNWEVMTSFFTEKMLPLYKKISSKVQN